MSEQKIPLLDLGPQTEALWDEYMQAVQEVLRGGRFILGPNVQAFEQEAATWLGAQHAVGVNSGTDALIIGLRAVGVKPGDEVITTCFSFFATAESISAVGARPVFVDIEPDTFNLDMEQVQAAVTERTRAILPVHLFGQAADMDPLRELAAERGLRIVEDCAQAFGADYRGHQVGTLGQAGCFSFFPSKPLGGMGDGGLLVTSEEPVAQEARMLRAHGARQKYLNEVIAYNSRLDELQAALLRVKLPHVAEWTAGRRAAAARYRELLSDVPGIALPVERAYGTHVYHQYTIRVQGADRDQVQAALQEAGVSTMIYYPVALHQLPPYAGQGGPLPVAEQACREVLSLPIWPEISAETQQAVAERLGRCLG